MNTDVGLATFASPDLTLLIQITHMLTQVTHPMTPVFQDTSAQLVTTVLLEPSSKHHVQLEPSS